MPLGRVAFSPSGFGHNSGVYDANQMPYFGFKVFTVPDPPIHHYQLPDMPFPDSVLVAVDGSVLQQGADYDYEVTNAGLIQFHIVVGHLTAGQQIIARWCAKEHLVA